MECSHELGMLSDMETVKVDSDFYYRKCRICKDEEVLPRAGKIYVGVSIEAEAFKDFERREFAKEHLQGYEPDGSTNALFDEAYGSPEKRGKNRVGKKVDKYRIKDEK